MITGEFYVFRFNIQLFDDEKKILGIDAYYPIKY